MIFVNFYSQRRDVMKTRRAVIFAFMFFAFVTAANAQDIMPAVDFFMYDRFYEVFLRDYFRFQEPKPLRIEYWYENWLDSTRDTDEYRDHLHIEGSLPIYTREKFRVNIPFQYSRVPVWAEGGGYTFGSNISVIKPYLITRWWITDRLKSIVGWEYNLKGDGEKFGAASGRQICLFNGLLSYDLIKQLNLVAGVRLDRYYYEIGKEHDIDEYPDAFKLARRLYYRPAAMLNWHPNNNFTILLGIPDSGVRLVFGDLLKAEARVDINKRFEVALEMNPVDRVRATLRFLNLPFTEIPIESAVFQENNPPAERLYFTSKSIILEVGWELNPASIASLGLRYSPSSNVELKDRDYKDVIDIDSKSSYAIGVTFIVDIEALIGIQ